MPRVVVTTNEERLDEIFAALEVEGTFGYTADYSPYVNWETHYAGTAPPFQPIRDWVHRKWNDLDPGLLQSVLTEKEKEQGIQPPAEEWKDRVASTVQHAIAANGTEAIRFMERSIERAKASIDAIEATYEGSEDIHAPFKIVRDVLDTAFGHSQDIIAEEATDTGNLLQSGYVDVEELQSGENYERGGRGG